jgi:hypothetical protein
VRSARVLGVVQLVGDVPERVADPRGQQDEGGDHRDRDEGGEQRVLNQVLAFFTLEPSHQLAEHILEFHLLCNCEFNQLDSPCE